MTETDYKCPKCDNKRDFRVAATMTECYTTIDGHGLVIEQEPGEINWHNNSWMFCPECNHEATVRDFKQAALARRPSPAHSSPSKITKKGIEIMQGALGQHLE